MSSQINSPLHAPGELLEIEAPTRDQLKTKLLASMRIGYLPINLPLQKKYSVSHQLQYMPIRDESFSYSPDLRHPWIVEIIQAYVDYKRWLDKGLLLKELKRIHTHLADIIQTLEK